LSKFQGEEIEEKLITDQHSSNVTNFELGTREGGEKRIKQISLGISRISTTSSTALKSLLQCDFHNTPSHLSCHVRFHHEPHSSGGRGR
jgi:hypothetical protein